MKTLFRKNLLPYLVILSGSSVCINVGSAPGTLSDIPLYLGSGATPNVLWVVDDSFSMLSEVLKRKSTSIDMEGNPVENGYAATTNYYEDFDDNVDESPDSKQELLEACSGYNVLAYDPDVTYVPWTRSDGTSFPSHNLATNDLNARDNPQASGRTDLSNARYMVWNDNGDGDFDRGECWENISAGADDTDAGTSAGGSFVNVSSLSDEAKVNYANWYTYYRKRTYVMKAILSGVFNDAEDRYGLATINSNSSIGLPVGETVDEDGVNTEHKETLVDKLLQVPASGTTPLKWALHNAGKYFDNEDGNTNLTSNFLNSTNPDSPIEFSCQANYTVLVTDGYYTSDENLTVGDLDTDSTDDNNEFNGAYYGDGVADTMADLAMYYFNKDLDSTQPDNFKSRNSLDKNKRQHMVTHAIAFGVEGNIDTSPVMVNGEETPRPIAEGWTLASNQWPAAVWDDTTGRWGSGTGSSGTRIPEDSKSSIDDLYHATFNSRGKFFSSSDPEQLSTDIKSILESIAQDTEGTAAAVGVNSTSISDGTRLYQAWFSSEDWTGELRAISFANGVVGDQDWEASDELNSRVADGDPRLLLTYSSAEENLDNEGNVVGVGSGVVFATPDDYENISTNTGEIGETHINDLLAHPYVSSVAAGAARQAALEELIDWFHGEQDNEIDPTHYFRTRTSLLGDIVYSGPQYVGAPSSGYPNHIESTDEDDEYFTFVEEYDERTPIVYVGSNDGMLHAFRASDGRELFAYLPELLFTDSATRGYHYLADKNYQHVPYVDSTPTVGDVFINGAWRSYLVGGLNAGGKGVYVLDVTNPVAKINSDNASDIVVQEFTHENLGYTYARPQIAKLYNGKWAAIFGNGYNNTGSGEASLFILYLEKDNDGNPENDYKEISTGVGGVVSSNCSDPGSDCNGLSSPSLVDINGDAIVDRVYAGDVHGNMWAFDLTSDDTDEWVPAHGGSNDEPLFVACRGSLVSGQCPITPVDLRQPITTKPVVVAHQSERSSDTKPNLFVMFGTGQYLTENDLTSTESQAFYGVWDAGESYGTRTRASLVPQVISTGTETFVNGEGETVNATVRKTTTNNVEFNELAVTGGFGWYMDLPTSKERSVLTPLITGNYVSFVTSIPNNETCSGAGDGWLMVAEIFSGKQPGKDVFNDIPASISGTPLDNLSGGMITLDNKYIGADSVGDIIVEDASWQQDRPSRRASWSIIR